MKNDITYEYRVFTHRLIDLESMEVGICTSKVIKGLKPKDKVNGRFFHTSDTDEWFFCWNDELQKLNLKGNSDVNSALAEVEKLIANANAAVSDAKKTAADAASAATEAKTAADAAIAAVESIENKADKSEVEAVSKAVEAKADASVVESLSKKVDDIKVPTNVSDLTNDLKFVTETELEQKGYATTAQVDAKQDVITDLDAIRSGAAAGATALQAVPEEYVTETELEQKGYLTVDEASSMFAPIGSEGGDMDGYATKKYVDDEIGKIVIPTVPTNVSAFTNDAGYLTSQDISGKQDVINDLETIRTNAEKGATALQAVPAEYITETELEQKGYATTAQVDAKQDVITDLDAIRSGAAAGATALQAVPEEYVTETELGQKGYITNQALGDYYTKDEVDDKIKAINDLIGQATDKTNTILNA